MTDDQELLRAFAEEKSQAAFAALVQQHLPMIYAAAYRQTGDAHRAEEIAQAAFTLLARKAGSLKNHPALGGWLYTTTAHLAARLRRTEARRARREQEAHAMHEANPPAPDVTGEALRPVVDEVMLALPEHDRTALLLRFFESRSHLQIGTRLGLSENAARMRVDRALDRLRAELGRRGIVSTATALGAALTASASLTPPAGLAGGITASASATLAGSGFFLLMNTSLLKTGIVVVAVGAGIGGLLWQHQENARLHEEVAALRKKAEANAPARTKPAASPAGDDIASTASFANLTSQVSTLPNDPAASWQERADVLKELMDQFPEFQIPELALATPEDWLDATKQPLTTDADYRQALAKVRTSVMMRFSTDLGQALRAYLQQNHGAFPTDTAQLEAYFAKPVSPEMLNHYKISPASRFPNLIMGGDAVITVKAPVDAHYDTQLVIGPQGAGATPVRSLIINQVREAYRAANPGTQPTSLADLLPYARSNFERAALRIEMTGK